MMDEFKPPAHLATAGREFWVDVAVDYGQDFETHEWNMLRLAAEALDRGVQSRRAIRKHGLTYDSKHGHPVARPEVAMERASVTRFTQLCKALGLGEIEPDVEPDEPPAGPLRGQSRTSTYRRRPSRAGSYAANKEATS